MKLFILTIGNNYELWKESISSIRKEDCEFHNNDKGIHIKIVRNNDCVSTIVICCEDDEFKYQDVFDTVADFIDACFSAQKNYIVSGLANPLINDRNMTLELIKWLADFKERNCPSYHNSKVIGLLTSKAKGGYRC